MSVDLEIEDILFENFTDEEEGDEIKLKKRLRRKPWVIYPEDSFKQFWDLVISMYWLPFGNNFCSVLIFTCVLIPILVAFKD